MKRLIILTAIALIAATAPGCYHGRWSGYRGPLMRNYDRNNCCETQGGYESTNTFSPPDSGCNGCGSSSVMPGEYLPPLNSLPVLPGPGIPG